jgi:hypothetical protein
LASVSVPVVPARAGSGANWLAAIPAATAPADVAMNFRRVTAI